MAIRLITGVPGSGKSAYAVDFSVKFLLAHPEKMLVTNLPLKYDAYVSYLYRRGYRGSPANIEIIDSDLDSYDFLKIPRDSLLILDEVHTLIGKGTSGPAVTRFRNFLRESRHAGVEVYLLTQAKDAIDPSVLKLLASHLQILPFAGFRVPLIGLQLGHLDLLQWAITGKPVIRSLLVETVAYGRVSQTVSRKVLRYDSEIFDLYDSYSAGQTAGGGVPQRPSLGYALKQSFPSLARIVLALIIAASTIPVLRIVSTRLLLAGISGTVQAASPGLGPVSGPGSGPVSGPGLVPGPGPGALPGNVSSTDMIYTVETPLEKRIRLRGKRVIGGVVLE